MDKGEEAVRMGIHDGHRGRMRARFLKAGLNGFQPHEALELLLQFAIPQKDTNGIAHNLMDRYGSLAAVLRAPVEDLQTVNGIGEYSAVLLHLVLQINDMAEREAGQRKTQVIDSSRKAGEFLTKCLAGKTTEVIYMLSLNASCELLHCECLEEGSVNRAHLSVQKVVKEAILHSASRVILGHNHPGGSTELSAEDIEVTARVKAALATIDVTLDDHIIVANKEFVSMSDLMCL